MASNTRTRSSTRNSSAPGSARRELAADLADPAEKAKSQQALLNKVEQSRPSLKSMSTAEYKKFIPLYRVYVANHGQFRLCECCTPDTFANIVLYLDSDSDAVLNLDEEELIKKLNEYHNIDNILDYKVELVKEQIKKTLLYNKSDIQNYMEQFVNKMRQIPGLMGATDGRVAVIVKTFISGLQPPMFRDMVQDVGPKNLKEVLKATREQITLMEIYVKYNLRQQSFLENTPEEELKNYQGYEKKSNSIPTKRKQISSSSDTDWTCENCGTQGHRWQNCSKKNTCLKCGPGVKVHAYWDRTECQYRQRILFNKNQTSRAAGVRAAPLPAAGEAGIHMQLLQTMQSLNEFLTKQQE
eukprot:CAMPEP_0182426360 /NCGR_PEP_ID=MMETSP1167-20130531/12843_1 /TAXON_ID=2988 /ORGANISM="Mallomonas Sp, Strain CCMP3275" /LENGTH=354 /DNA_ID=CAMNT_0024607721 /DNA_START=52 /DNA_END=1116 /DNA_ORIENTATION=+